MELFTKKMYKILKSVFDAHAGTIAPYGDLINGIVALRAAVHRGVHHAHSSGRHYII